VITLDQINKRRPDNTVLALRLPKYQTT
jgi:hypothetical protein